MYNINVNKRKKEIQEYLQKKRKEAKKMRVTKLIKEYVEEAINDIYNPLIEDYFADYEDRINEVEEILKEMTKEFNTAAEKMIEEHGFSINKKLNSEEKERIIMCCADFGDEEYSPTRAKIMKLAEERDQKIKSILINLELGGTRTELDKMLQKIKEEVAV